jgi:hypothetical protein
MSDATTRHDLPLLAAGQAQKELFHNEALTRVDMLLHVTVIGAGQDAPPSSPQPGDCWIVGGNPAAAWMGHADELASWTPGGWRFARPVPGMTAWLAGDKLPARWTGDGWEVGTVRARRLIIDDDQVLASREPAIAAPTGGAIIDTQARVAVSAILAALRHHGMIEA